jgi:hypothetical protein
MRSMTEFELSSKCRPALLSSRTLSLACATAWSHLICCGTILSFVRIIHLLDTRGARQRETRVCVGCPSCAPLSSVVSVVPSIGVELLATPTIPYHQRHPLHTPPTTQRGEGNVPFAPIATMSALSPPIADHAITPPFSSSLSITEVEALILVVGLIDRGRRKRGNQTRIDEDWKMANL